MTRSLKENLMLNIFSPKIVEVYDVSRLVDMIKKFDDQLVVNESDCWGCDCKTTETPIMKTEEYKKVLGELKEVFLNLQDGEAHEIKLSTE